MTSIYNFSLKAIDGNSINLSDYKDKVILIVNVASKCGFTPQYKELEELYLRYKDQGLIVLGIPCNQFGFQESGSNEEILEFCQVNFNISFPMFSKIKVNGKHTHPLYRYLKKEQPGLLGAKAIKWNFTKFLVNKRGEIIKRFGPSSSPLCFENEIKEALDN